MNEFKIKDESGLELSVAQDENESYEPILGGDNNSPTWDEYLFEYETDFQPHIKLIKRAIEQLGWVGAMAADKANNTVFIFSDGQRWGFSWRAWGDLMQAIVNKQEGYLVYYMKRKG